MWYALPLQKLKSKQQRSSSSLSAHRPPIGKMISLNDGRPLTAVDTESTQVSQTLIALSLFLLYILINSDCFGYEVVKCLIQICTLLMEN